MLLKVGELAKQTGLTVRALHHYDDIGLLQPSVRSDAGYRLYTRKDITRLHQIQALRGLGMSLAEIHTVLEDPNLALLPIIDQQIQAIDQRLTEQKKLRNQLSKLKSQIISGEELGLEEWLKTLELIAMFEKYFTKEELEKLTFLQAGTKSHQEWQGLTQAANALFNAGEPSNSEAAQDLARKWMKTLEHNTRANPKWLVKLNAINSAEPEFQEKLGVTPEVVEFLLKAFSESKLSIFARYLSDDEFIFLKENYIREMKKWPQLLVDIEKLIDAEVTPDSDGAKHLAQQWLSMLQGYAGKNPSTQEKIRTAMQNEPSLADGTWLKPVTLQFLEKAVAALMRGA
ncbi:MerR family transcriptional regulator [Acinetobacter pittii]|uniref:MerR family transcriptional regulator n=1 Tax=Acinetobacter pittii TaxID=48296 RepID=UPI002814280F|nr:MerR family transcriptional regulator [Acinetobacter pittii]MDQ9887447.1 MerR family transcriptional regulator [Acinetobacter pittii]